MPQISLQCWGDRWRGREGLRNKVIHTGRQTGCVLALEIILIFQNKRGLMKYL